MPSPDRRDFAVKRYGGATLFDTGGKSQTVVNGKGTQFTSNAILKFMVDRKFNWRCIARGKLYQNAFKEGFNGHLRVLLLNKALFLSLNLTRVTFAALRYDDNTERPHSRHVWPTPDEFVPTFAPQRGLTPSNPQSSAPAPVAQPAQIGKIQTRSLAHVG